MIKLLDGKRQPTACIALNNLLTTGVLCALRERGLTLPSDMSLISFDDMPTYPFIDPPLTAVAQPAYRMGFTAGALVLRRLRGERVNKGPVILDSEFRMRQSCATPRRGHRRASTSGR